ncbi:phosphoglucosamine mutase [Endozoicomonas sp. SESOKO3]|uniref:phosphoglucosamine mutase n=1 Tax=Endozoicomonas sp. SESOKO3 TaxID=2828744 RepID=UPI0021472C3A|nr:phosphoglucosamine mutase [Endozoicomonas sp. SESOKO3]
MTRKYFGTDGIRGRVGQFPITPDFVQKLGWAAGRVLKREGNNRVLIGKDTRISGYMFESALEAGLSAAGMDVYLLGPMPTPAVAYLTHTYNASAGIVISASHNPYYDNGIKFFCGEGLKLPDSVERQIEAMLEEPFSCVPCNELGKARRINDAAGRYIEFCKSTVQPRLNLHGLKIVVDASNGACYKVGPAVFAELGAEVISTGIEPNGTNINDGLGSTCINHLQQQVLEHHADLGIAFDGDGDRLIMVDGNGDELDGDELLFIMACSLQDRGLLQGGVVGTVMSNLGMEHALAERNIPFTRAAVGDRYVNELLLANGWYLGGESSGHLICRQVTTTGDGIVAALQVLAAVQHSGKTLAELKQGMNKYPQHLVNIVMTERRDLARIPAVTRAVTECEQALAGCGRVLLRPSGTEPVVRVMVEGEDKAEITQHCQVLAEKVEQVLKALNG